jgi:hypothetical protein
MATFSWHDREKLVGATRLLIDLRQNTWGVDGLLTHMTEMALILTTDYLNGHKEPSPYDVPQSLMYYQVSEYREHIDGIRGGSFLLRDIAHGVRYGNDDVAKIAHST